MAIYKAVETLECALINCDNILKVGPTMVEAVKRQIQWAIDELEKEPEAQPERETPRG